MRGMMRALFVLSWAALTTQLPMDVVRSRLLSALCYIPAPALNGSAALALSYARALQANHTWADINYHDPQDRTLWQTMAHLSRTQLMVAAWATPGSPARGVGALATAARNALAWWLAADPQNDNWWFNLIGVPQAVANIFLLLSAGNATAWPSPWDVERGLMIMFRSAWWDPKLGYETTGANLAWMVQTQIVRGVLPFAPNETALDQGFARLWAEAVTVNRSLDFEAAQGVQVDWSYSFHGPQIQVASYGQDFANSTLTMAAVAGGTPWAMGAAPAATLCAFLARGAAWLSVGASFDWTLSGRQASRSSWAAECGVTLSPAALRAFAAATCAAAAPGDAAPLRAWADRIDLLPPSPASPPLLGARHFWANDFTVVRRPGWVAALRAHSNRTLPNECGNGENLLGRYEAEGVLNVYGTDCAAPLACGAEYAEIFPLLNWTLLNGVLSRSSAPIPDCAGNPCCWLSEVSRPPFVAAATDGSVAAAAVDTVVGPLTARRAFFFFEDAVLALTAGASDGSGAVVSTGVAQRFLRQAGGLLAAVGGGAPALLPDGEYASLPGLDWAFADGVGWLAPAFLRGGGAAAAATPAVFAGLRTGSWRTIGPYTGNVSGRVLSLSLTHGARLAGNESWAYAVLPAQSALGMPAAAAAARDALAIGENSARVQAAAHARARAAAAIVWPDPGGGLAGGAATIAAAGFSLALNLSAPGVVTYAEQADAGHGAWALVAAASPLPAVAELAVTLSRRLAPLPPGASGLPCPAEPAAGGGTLLRFPLPTDANTTLGASVVFACAVG